MFFDGLRGSSVAWATRAVVADMDFIFNSVADVAVLFGLIVFCFPDSLSGAVFRLGVIYRKDEYYKETAARVRAMPPWWLIPLGWFILDVLIVAAFYIIYRSVDLTALYGEAIDAMTLLFIFNIPLQKLWAQLLFVLHMPWLALIDIVLLEATAVGILVFMWVNNYNTPFWLYLWYPIFALYPFYINCAWLYARYSMKGKRDKKCEV